MARFAFPLRTFAPTRHLQLVLQRASYYSVGSPDPRSNMRPVVYDGPPPSTSTAESAARQEHPYSLREFTKSKMDYQLKSERQRLDAFNHGFWVESNSRFEKGKQDVLNGLPEGMPPDQKESALSDFYCDWLGHEKDRQREYTNGWRHMNWNEIVLTGRVGYRDLKARLAARLSFESSPLES